MFLDILAEYIQRAEDEWVTKFERKKTLKKLIKKKISDEFGLLLLGIEIKRYSKKTIDVDTCNGRKSIVSEVLDEKAREISDYIDSNLKLTKVNHTLKVNSTVRKMEDYLERFIDRMNWKKVIEDKVKENAESEINRIVESHKKLFGKKP